MGASKAKGKSKGKGGSGKGRRAEAEDRPGIFTRVMGAITSGLGAIGERTRVAQRVGAGLAIVGLVVAWVLGLGPLQERVAAQQSDPIDVRFAWPATRASRQTWVPPSVRADLSQIVLASVRMDPFDVVSLEEADARLRDTGWFLDVGEVRREPGGIVEIDGRWRTPAAVVSFEGREYLVGVDTAVMRMPPDAEAPRGMFRIMDPLADAPRDPETGRLLYGHPWHFDDVKHAIALLELVARMPEADAIVGVDLSEYPRRGRLSLVTDAGCSLVWGSPVGESAPGEVGTERKMAHLGAILDPARRLDRGQRRIEVFTERVFIDRTPGGASG